MLFWQSVSPGHSGELKDQSDIAQRAQVRPAEEQTVELRHLEAERLLDSGPALGLGTAGMHEETR